MGRLEEYRAKRDFGRTPEPSGGAASEHEGLLYYVQKHAASHLHYDFRIELDGVLLSWAVPKGPSLDPSDKRLAMHVEDHPIEYGTFEGVIPKGEYGGGTVMLWDRGTWEPDHGDPRQHLAEGHLKFYLHGERLRGRWMLVRTKGYGGKPSSNSWLLFKEHDAEERPHSEFDPTAEWQASVVTGRTMDEIAADVQAVWHSTETVEANTERLGGLLPREPATGSSTGGVKPADVTGAKKARLPRTIEVELATLVDAVPEGERWLHEIKFDGYRIVAFKDAEKVRLVSRNQKDWTERFPEVADAVRALPCENLVLDGEVVVQRPDGTNDFQALQNHAKSGVPATLQYFAFDLLHLDGYDLREAALEDRKQVLQGLVARRGAVPGGSSAVHYTDHVSGHGDIFFKSACDFSLEGIVSKRGDRPYRSGRGREWVKTKCLLRQEFVVVGWTDPGGSRKGFGALVIGLHGDGGLRYTGRVGTGFTQASIAEILGRLEPLAVDEPPVVNAPKGAAGRAIHWVRPELVAEVSFAEWTEDGSLRHPSFQGLREDKPATDVAAEEPQAVAPPPPVAEKPKPDAPIVAGVLLTNPDRVFWPDVGITKLEACRYYESVAELMLPHMVGRPLSLVRCPEGYTGQCFYQKHIENFPKSVDAVGVYEPEEDRVRPYGTVHDLAGVIGLVQMGVLEIHPWGSRNDDIEKPDRITFDLDPDPELPFAQVGGTALLLRAELERLGLRSWPKTTGGKGLHVVVPLTRRQDWDAAKAFAKAFVDSIVAIEPRLFTSNMSKAQRDGRIFIDYLRNARGATAVAPYSTRARPEAPVSMPLFWSELDGASERPYYTVRNVGERLSGLNGDPWVDIGTHRQSITAEARRKLGVDAQELQVHRGRRAG